ncbi:MAG TPA: alpha/beta fold hydrolase [Steroidobacteraceae bacterium]|nr:alpha/beta fold hydrolase [Steroidobacteraceae bacterium]
MSFELDDTFRPPRWLRGTHLQSMLPSLPVRRGWIERRALSLIRASEEILLDCGDGVRLQAFASSQVRRGRDPGKRIAVLLHGWEGSADSLYVLSLAQELYARDYEVVRLNLRDHGATHHLNREIFHSCRLPEVLGAMRTLQARFGGRPLHLAGFSLGGNFMLRVAAEARDTKLDVAAVVAVSPVLDPAQTLVALERGFFAYHTYFVRKWVRSLLKKQAAWPDHYDFAHLGRLRGLREMTATLVGDFTDFPSLDAYLSGYAITGDRLEGIDMPATIVTALDDPIIPVHDLRRLARPRSLAITVTRHGGHNGFLDHLSSSTFADRVALAAFDRA